MQLQSDIEIQKNYFKEKILQQNSLTDHENRHFLSEK